MEFKRIFTKDIVCKLWSVRYPEHGKDDIFKILFNNWGDPRYLYNFFDTHQDKLLDPYWDGLEVEDAIDEVEADAIAFESKIKAIQKKLTGYESVSIEDIFQPLHKGVYEFKPEFIDQKKAKPFAKSMLRLYAIKLDYAFIVTGGAIKLVKEMRDSYMQPELDNLKRVQRFFKQDGIYCPEGFDNFDDY